MSNQARCPNCRGYKVNAEKQELITETRKVPMSVGKILFSGIFLIVIFAISGLILWELFLSSISILPMLLFGLFGLLSLGIILYLVFYLIRRRIIEAQKGTLLVNEEVRVGTLY